MSKTALSIRLEPDQIAWLRKKAGGYRSMSSVVAETIDEALKVRLARETKRLMTNEASVIRQALDIHLPKSEEK